MTTYYTLTGETCWCGSPMVKVHPGEKTECHDLCYRDNDGRLHYQVHQRALTIADSSPRVSWEEAIGRAVDQLRETAEGKKIFSAHQRRTD